jgi:hypothetical protein
MNDEKKNGYRFSVGHVSVGKINTDTEVVEIAKHLEPVTLYAFKPHSDGVPAQGKWSFDDMPMINQVINMSDFDVYISGTWTGTAKLTELPVTVNVHPMPLMYLFPDNPDDYPDMRIVDNKLNVPRGAIKGRVMVKMWHPEKDTWRWAWVWIERG